MNRITQAELARRLGVSPAAVSRAVRAGRVSADAAGLLDPVGAAAQFDANRLRRRRRQSPDLAPGDAVGSSVAGPSFRGSARDRMDAAQAEIAELRAAELRGDLVRRAMVEQSLASRLVALRDSLESVGDRIGSLVASEQDAVVCRRIVLDEIRQALKIFAAELEGQV